MAVQKNKAVVFMAALALILTVVAAAHEGGKHFLGSVKSFDATSLTIVTTTKETVTVKLLPTTKFVKGKQAASAQDLKAGERVAIHAKQNGTSWEAEEVHFSTTAPAR